MSEATEAVLFNALPLFCLAAAYAGVAAAILPALWRGRAMAHPLDWGIVLIFPAIAFAGAVFGGLVIRDLRPFGGHVWLSLAAVLVAILPALLLLARWRDRAFVVGGIARTREAEERVSARERELAAVAQISNALTRARTPEEVARPLVRQVCELLQVGFAAVTLVDESRGEAVGTFGELGGKPAASWPGMRVDLRHEPSGIASAVYDAAPVAVYDVTSSPLVSARLVKLVGARSGAWIPMIAEERVIGVLVVASTAGKRAFASEELALLQALSGEAALALERISSAAALSDALDREQAAAEIARQVRAQLDPDEVVRVAREELRLALSLDEVDLRLGRDAVGDVAVESRGERMGALTARRAEPFTHGESFLLETAAREVGAALQTARLVAENQRRLEQQAALLHAAQVVTGELQLETVLERLVEEVTKLLRADAADLYLLERERRVLRCAAVHGFDESLVGFEFAAGPAASRLVEDPGEVAVNGPAGHPAYEGFKRALDAPMVWGGETLGVLGVRVRDGARTFTDADLELLEAFASLASLALRNASSFEERVRQSRVERGFNRIALLLGEPVSLAETYDAAAQAAAEALGGDSATVLVQGATGFSRVGGHALPDEVARLEPAPVFGAVVGDVQLLASRHVSDDDRFPKAWREGPFASLLAIPVGGEIPGLVVVFFAEEREFVRDDLELAQQLANAARGALDRSRLFEAERAARSLSQQLARTSSLLATELDPAAVLEAVVEEAVSLLAVDGAALATLDGDDLAVVAAVGAGADEALGARAPSGGWLGGDVARSRAPVMFDDVTDDPALLDADVLLAAGHRAYLGVPLEGREGAFHGVLSVYASEPRHWRGDEVQALEALAANASAALSNAELYQRVAVEREQSLAILANIADGIVAVDRDGLVVLWNQAAEQITGVPTAEALGRTPVQVLQRDLDSESGGMNRLVSILRGKDEVWLSLSETVMRDPAGAVAGRIFAFRDISAERVVEQMKSDFVSTVSHELRTPLTSIYGFAETLLRGDIEFSDEERRTFLAFIAAESERLTLIVDTLLNVARLDRGDLQVLLERIDVAAVVADVVSVAEQTSVNGHRIVADVEPAPLQAQADRAKLRQVLEQLISNAVKYSPDGGLVTVSARRNGEAVEVAVADEGIGVPAAERERIFSKFYKAGDDQTRGTGLGLFIVQGLVREMGGSIWVDSEEGRGSRFAFQLPLAGDE